jgi:hypothetical protein
MLMIIQAAGPVLSWWVLYATLIASTWGAWRLAQARGCAPRIVACSLFIPVLVVALLTLPDRFFSLGVALAIVPGIAMLAGVRRRRGDEPENEGGLAVRPMARLPRRLRQGQPRADAVMRSKVTARRVEAGMPADATFVARVRYLRGVGEMTPRPVDLLVGGGRLWVAPLTEDEPITPIPLRDVLRVDLWPEMDAPPTLRVSWSPPAGELTAELVLGTMPNIPPPLIVPQLQAIAGVLTGIVRSHGEAVESASNEPAQEGLRACPACGETMPRAAAACPRCAVPTPN